jgi:hypothetical protein
MELATCQDEASKCLSQTTNRNSKRGSIYPHFWGRRLVAAISSDISSIVIYRLLVLQVKRASMVGISRRRAISYRGQPHKAVSSSLNVRCPSLHE